jgi:membrane protease subunit HflC
MKKVNLWMGVSILALVFVLNNMLFTIHETERGIISRLGHLVKDSTQQVKVLMPGLGVKIPLIDQVVLFDHRLQMSKTPAARVVTKEKKDVIVDLFVQWQIEDFALFFTRTANIARADGLLQQKVVDIVRAEFGQLEIKKLISEQRVPLMERLCRTIDGNVSEYGIKVVDVRIKAIDFPLEISEAVFDRMRSERKQAAVELRAGGEADAEAIRAEADRLSRVLLAEAKQTAQQLRGAGDALATQIYASVYNKAPAFFKFWRSLEAYKKSFNKKNDVLVLKPEGDFFKFFHQSELEEK